jgi:hypothetical protein
MLNYTLIIVVVVILFLAYKNKEGLTNEKSINPGGDEIPVPITLQIDKKPQSYQAFAATITDYCSYYGSGNNINTAINLLGRDISFTSTVDYCYNHAKNDTATLNKCYATALASYKPASSYETNPTEYIQPCIASYNSDKPGIPKLESATSKPPIPGQRGWVNFNYFATQQCKPYNSLTDIDAALEAGKNVVMSNIPQCADAILK